MAKRIPGTTERRRQALCRVCKQYVPSELCTDFRGVSGRVIMPHNGCSGRFRTTSLLNADKKGG